MTSPQASPIPNAFKHDLAAGKRLIGCWCSLGNAITTEIRGIAGVDWLLLDGEHAPNDVLNFIPQLMALKDSPSAAVVRPKWNDMVEIKQLLDIGFYNFLIPFVESADDARRAATGGDTAFCDAGAARCQLDAGLGPVVAGAHRAGTGGAGAVAAAVAGAAADPDRAATDLGLAELPRDEPRRPGPAWSPTRRRSRG